MSRTVSSWVRIAKNVRRPQRKYGFVDRAIAREMRLNAKARQEFYSVTGTRLSRDMTPRLVGREGLKPLKRTA